MPKVLLPSKSHNDPLDIVEMPRNAPFTFTNMLGLTGQHYVQLAGMLHDQLALQVTFDGRDITVANHGDSPVSWAFGGLDIPAGISRFKSIPKNHRVSAPSSIMVVFFCIDISGSNRLAELSIADQVTLRII